ncbi:MAG: hypothetical protein RL726_470, partial [Actinomycetota bacterium]
MGTDDDDELICTLPPDDASRPSPWFAVGAWSMFALSAAIAVAVMVSSFVS